MQFPVILRILLCKRYIRHDMMMMMILKIKIIKSKPEFKRKKMNNRIFFSPGERVEYHQSAKWPLCFLLMACLCLKKKKWKTSHFDYKTSEWDDCLYSWYLSNLPPGMIWQKVILMWGHRKKCFISSAFPNCGTSALSNKLSPAKQVLSWRTPPPWDIEWVQVQQ